MTYLIVQNKWSINKGENLKMKKEINQQMLNHWEVFFEDTSYSDKVLKRIFEHALN